MPRKYIINFKAPNSVLQKNNTLISEKEYNLLSTKLKQHYSVYKLIVAEDLELDNEEDLDFDHFSNLED